MVLAKLRRMLSARPKTRRRSARRRLEVEQLEHRQLLATGVVNWAEGTVAPLVSVSPASPAPGDTVFFTLDGPTFGNSCYGMLALGGRPALAINETAQTVDLVFVPLPEPFACLDVYNPVAGFYGEIRDLTPGAWTLRGLGASAITFTVQAPVLEPILLPFETVDQGSVSYFGYGDSGFTGADFVIADADTWQWFWTLHTAGLFPQPETPAINFEAEMVIVTIMGLQSSGGPSTAVEAVYVFPEHDYLLGVFVADDRQPGFLTVITNPFHIVKVPLTGFSSAHFFHRDVGQPTALPFETVQQGSISYISYGDPGFTGQDQVILDPETWQAFWAQHRSGVFPTPPAPEINFETQMVIVTVMGFRSSGGYSTTIQGVTFNPTDGTLTVRVEDDSPEPGDIVLTVITNPFHIVVLDRVAFTSVVFEHQDV